MLELGGNAAVIVDRDADLDDAVERIIFGAFYQSGQSCIGVQRIIIHADIYDDAPRPPGRPTTSKLVAGDPKDRDTFIGPMISEGEARRLDNWIQEAVAAGAKLLCGGKREGAMLEATLLEDVDRGVQRLSRGGVRPGRHPLAASATSTPPSTRSTIRKFGLQAGIFTRDLFQMLDAWDRLDVGGVVINDVPSYRVDNMPYGGVKDSGLGREGVRFAMEDMTEIRNLVIRRGAGADLHRPGKQAG